MSLTFTQAQMDIFQGVALKNFCNDLLSELEFEFYREIHSMPREEALEYCLAWVTKAKDFDISSKHDVFIFMKAVFTLKKVIDCNYNKCKNWFEGILMDDSYFLPEDKVKALYKRAIEFTSLSHTDNTEF